MHWTMGFHTFTFFVNSPWLRFQCLHNFFCNEEVEKGNTLNLNFHEDLIWVIACNCSDFLQPPPPKCLFFGLAIVTYLHELWYTM